MKTLYKVEGVLSKEFIGQISYTISLEREYQHLDIEFSFDKQHYTAENLTAEKVEEITAYCLEEYGLDLKKKTDDPYSLIMKEGKTEIHLLATLNDEFIGCIHRQLTERKMRFAPGFATEGCIAQDIIGGVLKVTILVFNVILDDTHYSLQVSGK
jgi:hypothetical protein